MDLYEEIVTEEQQSRESTYSEVSDCVLHASSLSTHLLLQAFYKECVPVFSLPLNHRTGLCGQDGSQPNWNLRLLLPYVQSH